MSIKESINNLFKMLCCKTAVVMTTMVTLLSLKVRNPSKEMLLRQSLSWTESTADSG